MSKGIAAFKYDGAVPAFVHVEQPLFVLRQQERGTSPKRVAEHEFAEDHQTVEYRGKLFAIEGLQGGKQRRLRRLMMLTCPAPASRCNEKNKELGRTTILAGWERMSH